MHLTNRVHMLNILLVKSVYLYNRFWFTCIQLFIDAKTLQYKFHLQPTHEVNLHVYLPTHKN